MTDPNDPRLKLDMESPGDARAPARDETLPVATYAQPRRQAHLTDYIRILYKRRWLVITSFLLVFITTAVYTYTLTPMYEARAKLLIDSGTPNYVNFEEVVEQNSATLDYVQTQYDLLRSRSLARKTSAALGFDKPAPAGEAAPKAAGARTRLRSAASSVKRLFVSPKPPPPPRSEEAKDAIRESRGVDMVLGLITVAPVRNSRIVDLKAASPDPHLAMTVVNAHAKAYIEQNLEFKFNTSKEASDWLGERLAEQRQEVEKAEAALQQYRERNHAIPAEDTSNIVVQKLGQLNSAVTVAKTKRLEIEAVYEQLRAVEGNPAGLEAFPDILASPNVQAQRTELANLLRREGELSQKFAENHPELQAVRTNIQATRAKLQAETNNVVRSIRTQFETAKNQEQNLARALQLQNQEALAMNRTAIEFGVLKRDAESARLVYETLLQKANETGVSSELRTSNVRIVDLAELPRSPASPNRRKNITMGFFAGLLIALALGFFFEYLDNRIKAPEEIKDHLGLAPLGLLPVIRGMAAQHPYPLLTGNAWPKLNEAFRTLRTNIIFSTAEQKSRSVMVTSTGPNEGKTLVSANLAISLAQAGLRVLVIDSDMRRPSLHKAFDVEQEPGLSNLLVGEAKASETVRKTSIPGLWVLPAGRNPPNPAELLGSLRFRGFLDSLREHFEWVVIDSPPVMAVADAAIVAHSAMGVVFVIGSEMVSRYTAQAALEQLESARAHLIGAVLNRVDLDKHAFYYSQYYRKEYTAYYTVPSKT